MNKMNNWIRKDARIIKVSDKQSIVIQKAKCKLENGSIVEGIEISDYVVGEGRINSIWLTENEAQILIEKLREIKNKGFERTV
jgi:hypothetical protein